MKRSFRTLLTTLMALSLGAVMLTGCTSNNQATTDIHTTQTTVDTTTTPPETSPEATPEPEIVTSEKKDVSILSLKGPTAMGLTKFMSDVDAGLDFNHNYQFTIASAIDEVTPQLIQKKVDIAAIPANLSSVLYNRTEGQIRVLAINTLGVLYLVENGESISSISDLAGKTIYASGKGATPEYNLNYVLKNNGIDPETDVTIEWKSEHGECLSALASTENSIALLPQPFVTVAQNKVEGLRIALDLTAEWDALQEGKENPSALITGVVVAQASFVEENPEVVTDFLANYAVSAAYVNANVEEAAILVGDYDIVDANVAKKAIPACNITFITGSELQEKLSGYLTVLFEENPASVGSSLPADDFYYE